MAEPDWFESAHRDLFVAEKFPLLQRLPNARVLARLWRFPTFEPCMSLTILATDREIFVRRIVASPVHALVATDVRHKSVAAEARVEPRIWLDAQNALRQFSFGVFDTGNHEGIGRDGTTYGLSVGAQNNVRLEWCQEAPTAWQDVAQWHQNLTQALQARLPAHVAT